MAGADTDKLEMLSDDIQDVIDSIADRLEDLTSSKFNLGAIEELEWVRGLLEDLM